LVEYHKVINNYSQKTPICCHAYRVNCLWQEAENRQGAIIPQTFCYLKEIELKTFFEEKKHALMALPSTTLDSMIRWSIKQFLPKPTATELLQIKKSEEEKSGV